MEILVKNVDFAPESPMCRQFSDWE